MCLAETVNQAVRTVPADVNDSQRQASKDTGKMAGLEVLLAEREAGGTGAGSGMGLTAVSD